MGFYSNNQLTIFTLFKDSLFHYAKAFKSAFWYIVLAVLAHNSMIIQNYFPAHSIAYIVMLVIASLLSLYFWSSALYAAHCALKSEVVSLNTCLIQVLKRFLRIVLVALLYVLVFVLMIFWLQFLNHLVGNLPQAAAIKWWINLFAVGLPLLVFMLLFLLAIPLIIVENLTFFRALGRSAKMVWLSVFKSTLVLYAGILVLFYIVLPGTQHVRWLQDHHLKVLFDLVIFLVFAPIVINYALLVLNNLQNFLRDRNSR